jgi:aspartate/methionine/tyrosine aminotransferase
MPASPFETMDRAKAEARAKGLEVIDLSIGSSDLGPPPAALEALREATHEPETYGYCLFSRTLELREAVAAWFLRRYEQALEPNRHVLPLIGSQEGFANLLLAVTDPGDTILAPDPGYPSYYGAIAIAGLELVTMPLLEANGYLPDLSAVASDDARRARVLVLSYPNNPTAAVASEALFDEAIAFCHANDVLLVHDFPYVDMVYGDYRAPSVLAQKGGLETAIELYSCSKSFHMGGFRIGWAAGNEDAVAALRQVKGAIDFNQYLGIQRAAVAALRAPGSELRKAAQVFEARRDALVSLLNRSAWPTPLPQASMYVWTRLPRGFTDSYGFATLLARQTGVCLGPGRSFGEEGEGYVRFALVREPEALERAVSRIRDWLD